MPLGLGLDLDRDGLRLTQISVQSDNNAPGESPN